jgi:hypothetical protein
MNEIFGFFMMREYFMILRNMIVREEEEVNIILLYINGNEMNLRKYKGT